MISSEILETYYSLFLIIVESLRSRPKDMAETLGLTGRGRSPSTIWNHLQNMYEKKISREPILILNPFEGLHSNVYFCRKSTRKGLRSTFLQLYQDEKVDYVLFLSGASDFFITTRASDLDFSGYGLEVQEKSDLFAPVFTIPRGWKLSVSEALDSVLSYHFSRKDISREVGTSLQWKDVDWEIYEAMKFNGRKEFAKVARETGIWPKTVQSHFYRSIFPCCTVGHYFFPKGYDFYDKALLKITSSYERDIVRALERLPCTTHVFPLEKELILILFHESISKVMDTTQKMEEIGIVDDYLLYVPLTYGF
ncbi:MAG: hypothetical protein AYK19_16035 [Theionarchaea archaeon DG-70-1]|nr:MAG: hypothetical protein AYK19_16035 [Theionarchaea archaeon DG-70-1]